MRAIPLALLAIVSCGIAAPAAAQLAAPQPPTQTRTAAPPVQRAPALPSTPAQRPLDATPIRSTGPSTPPAAPTVATPQPPVSATSVPVRDAQGRTVHGAVRVSPTRAWDPARGRYVETRPATPAPATPPAPPRP